MHSNIKQLKKSLLIQWYFIHHDAMKPTLQFCPLLKCPVILGTGDAFIKMPKLLSVSTFYLNFTASDSLTNLSMQFTITTIRNSSELFRFFHGMKIMKNLQKWYNGTHKIIFSWWIKHWLNIDFACVKNNYNYERKHFECVIRCK